MPGAKELKELADKRSLLGEARLRKIKKPDCVSAQLRDYQQAGFNWLATLYKLQLGGCLADDMGLGKTLQVLTLLAYARQKSQRKYLTNLVVCPTSLIYNWRNELEKFTPSLKVKVHYGNNRATQVKDWRQTDVIITTYGTLANDMEWLRKFTFHIACLDESQTIKNPSSLRFKAVSLLKAEHRFVMTGTPIENSTVELFAQMQFINPGLLGTLTGFKDKFSNHIDTQRNPALINQLKQLIKPFLLRRTKEEVATDLPAKTEQVLFCEMGEEQRLVYDSFKQVIRNQLLGLIEQETLEKSKLSVLEGLTKLRQICDSPALLNAEESLGDQSVKADELVRLITTKIRDHKALVFSQFLGMLDIIEERLRTADIPYLQLTGRSW
ncbi:MAG: DEAD/DEAH box helicase family protein [Marinilabiliaceae bacterium]|nr:DEAD/DEAH box helicase family protein [Marinilabiliaceae bacterium]